MSAYSYRIERRPERLGGGWRLQFLHHGVAVDARAFPAPLGNTRAAKRAYVEALGLAKQWLTERAEGR